MHKHLKRAEAAGSASNLQQQLETSQAPRAIATVAAVAVPKLKLQTSGAHACVPAGAGGARTVRKRVSTCLWFALPDLRL
jgi:hypothetical protein